MAISAEAVGPPGARRTVFVDFEASSLAKGSYPIEVAWVFEDGSSESHLIRPAPAWTEWAESAERIHGIPRDTLFTEGLPHEEVARRMVNRLTGHALYVTAPSWDGQWLSKLLRAASLPRHALRVEDTTLAHARVVRAVFAAADWDEAAGREAGQAIIATIPAEADGPPAHRALGDARKELALWHRFRQAATAMTERHSAPDAWPGSRPGGSAS